MTTITNIGTGTYPNDTTGTPLQTAGQIINANFAALNAAIGSGGGSGVTLISPSGDATGVKDTAAFTALLATPGIIALYGRHVLPHDEPRFYSEGHYSRGRIERWCSDLFRWDRANRQYDSVVWHYDLQHDQRYHAAGSWISHRGRACTKRLYDLGDCGSWHHVKRRSRFSGQSVLNLWVLRRDFEPKYRVLHKHL